MNHDLADELGDAASTIDVPPGDVIDVMTRSRRRSRRHQRLVGLALAVVVVGAATAIVRVADGEDETAVATDGRSIQMGDAGVDWSRRDPTAVLSLYQRSAGTSTPSGALYALSTAPGQAPSDAAQPRVVWRSEDGVDWSPLARPDDLYLSDLSARGDRLYAVGTGPATARTTGGDEIPGVHVSWSDDGAQTWQSAALDIDLAAIADGSQQVMMGSSQVAAGPSGVVAIASVSADLDVPSLLPAGVVAEHGWAISPTGVDLLGAPPGGCPAGTTSPEDVKSASTLAPAGAPVAQDDVGRVWPTICLDGEGREREVSPQELLGVVGSFTWEELGVGGDLLQAVLGRPFVFRAEPEWDAFSRIDPGLPDDIAGSVILDVRDGDFLLAVPVFSGGVNILTSGDGVSWAGSRALGEMRWISAAGRIGDRLAFLGGDREGRMMLALGDASGWRDVDLGAAAGFDDEPFVVDAAFGPDGVVAVVGEMAGSRTEQVEPNFHLVASRDGTTWSSRSAADVAGEPVASVGGVTVTDDGVVVMAVPEQERVEGQHLRQVALVGTYR